MIQICHRIRGEGVRVNARPFGKSTKKFPGVGALFSLWDALGAWSAWRAWGVCVFC